MPPVRGQKGSSSMARFGYKLSSEEHDPHALVEYARRAEATGFDFAAISDHFHPWTSKQGHSPFVWTVLGAIANATSRLELLTGVTCPTIRMDPTIVAHAAATTAVMFEGRFTFGIGSGEHLNEHVTGEKWPPVATRLEMLEEAVDVIRLLWQGGLKNHRGAHFTVENARLYDLPDQSPAIAIAASGERATRVAAEKGDALIAVAPQGDLVTRYRELGGEGPAFAEVNMCWARDEDGARRTVYEYWPVAGFKGQLMQELALPSQFEAGAEMIDVDDATENVSCGPDPDRHLAEVRKFLDAGFDHIWLHQIGPDQEGFFAFCESELLPRL